MCVLVCLMRLTAVCKFLGSMRYRLVILWSLIMSELVNIMWLIKRSCSAHGSLSHLHSWETSSALLARICFSPVCLQLISFNRPSICCALYCLCVSVFSSSLRRTIYTTSHVVYTVLLWYVCTTHLECVSNLFDHEVLSKDICFALLSQTHLEVVNFKGKCKAICVIGVCWLVWKVILQKI